MTYLTIARIAGDPQLLLDGYEQASDVMSAVGRDHGLLLHAAAATDEGLLIVNLWPSQEESQAAAGDSRRRDVILRHGLTAGQVRHEHHVVAHHELPAAAAVADLTALLEPLRRTWATLLRTRKRDGRLVDTPVNVVFDGDRAFFSTPADAAKVKRLRNFPEVEVAACTLRGRPTSPTLHASARRLDGESAARARALLRARHPLVHRFVVPLELRLNRTHEAVYELGAWRVSETSGAGG